jgi:hypothetical protein
VDGLADAIGGRPGHPQSIPSFEPGSRTMNVRGARPSSTAAGTHEVDAGLAGRERELARLLEAVHAGAPTECVAPCGFGKSTLLSHAAAMARTEWGWRVALVTADSTASDTIRALARRLEATDGGPASRLTVAAGIVRTRLQLLVIDDVGWTPQECHSVRRLLRGCSLLIASERPALGAGAVSLRLAGLPLDAAGRMLAAGLGHELSPEERPALVALHRAVKGRPLALTQAAALIGDNRSDLKGLADSVTRDPASLERLTSRMLSAPQSRVISLLALVAGAALPHEVIELLSDVQDVQDAFRTLTSVGVMEDQGDRYGLPRCRGEHLRLQYGDLLTVGQVGRQLADWLRDHGTNPDAVDVAEAAVSLVRHAAERGEWRTVIHLVDTAEPVLTLAGKWDTAMTLLDQGARAAEQLSDTVSRHRFDDRRRAAPDDDVPPDLRSWATRLWSATRHAVRRLIPTARMGAAAITLILASASLGGYVYAQDHPPATPPAPSLSTSTSALNFGQLAVGARSATQTIRVSGSGAGSITVLQVTIAGGATTDFTVNEDTCTSRVLTPTVACSIRVSSHPDSPGLRTAKVLIRPGNGQAASTITVQVVGVRGNPPPSSEKAPELAVPASMTVEAQKPGGAVVRYHTRATDWRGRAIKVTCSPPSRATFPLGTTTVNCRTVDSRGRTTKRSFEIRVIDSRGPRIVVEPTTFEATRPSGAVGITYVAGAVDQVDGSRSVRCKGPEVGSDLPLGRHTLTCEAEDKTGNRSRLTVQLHVVDTTPPELSVPADFSVFPDGSVSFEGVTATDAVDKSVDWGCEPAAGPLKGTTTFRCHANDDERNEAAASFTVTVKPFPIVT